MRVTEEWYADYTKRHASHKPKPHRVPPKTIHKCGEMNKTEARYASLLEALKRGGEILDWSYESITFKLGKDCRYTPDFMVIYPDRIRIVETKGSYIRDDARIKWRVVQQQYPWFEWVMARWIGGEWIYE